MLNFIRMLIKHVIIFSYEPLTYINLIDFIKYYFLHSWDNPYLSCFNTALDAVIRNVVFYFHRKTGI